MSPVAPINAALPDRLLAYSRYLRTWLMPFMLLFCVSATASDSVLLVHDGKNELASQIIQSLTQQLSKESVHIDILDIASQPLPENPTLQNYSTVITLGNQATEASLKKNPHVSLLSLLVSRQSWSQLKYPENGHSRSVILLDQPVDRQLHFIRALFGDNNSIGILLGPYSSSLEKELIDSARHLNQKLAIKTIENDDELIPSLSNLTEKSDVLLAIPDAIVYNKRSIQGILLLTYRNKTPVIGFSQAYSRAGAVASLFSSADNIAQHTAEIIRDKSATSRIYYPKYYSINFNQQVARTLGITPLNEKELIERLDQEEKSHP